MRVVVFGAAGMLGRVSANALRDAGYDVECCTRDGAAGSRVFDVERDLTQLDCLLREIRCAVAVNCAGVLASSALQTEADARARAVTVNATFPLALGEAARARGMSVLHISSDGVFSGRSHEPYVETDAADPVDDYGWTKALGESPAPNVISLRCSIVGVDARARRGLIEWFLAQPEGGQLNGFEDQAWNGVTTLQLADLLVRLAERRSFDELRSRCGVHHFCPNTATTKYGLLVALNAATGNRRTVAAARSGGSLRGRLLATRYGAANALVPSAPGWSDLITQLVATR